MLDLATGSKAHALSERGNDLYETPIEAIRALCAVENLPHTIWEPACGPGAIVKHLRSVGHTVHATDLVDYGLEGSTSGRDFLMEYRIPDGVEYIITNPPFKLAEDFISKSMALVPKGCFLMRLAFLEGLRWQERGLADHLARVWVFAPRLPFMHRHGWDGPKNSNSGMPFAWYVFERNASTRGSPVIKWIDPRPYMGGENV